MKTKATVKTLIKFINSYKAHFIVLMAICFFLVSKDMYLLFCQKALLDQTITERISAEETLAAKEEQLEIYCDPDFVMRYAIDNLNLIPNQESEDPDEIAKENEQ